MLKGIVPHRQADQPSRRKGTSVRGFAEYGHSPKGLLNERKELGNAR